MVAAEADRAAACSGVVIPWIAVVIIMTEKMTLATNQRRKGKMGFENIHDQRG